MRRNHLVIFDMHQTACAAAQDAEAAIYAPDQCLSKKFEDHMRMVALWYNYVKQHKSLKGLSPAMAAGLGATLWEMKDLAEMVDAAAPKPGPRDPYKKTVEV